jgi:hypothetical protein
MKAFIVEGPNTPGEFARHAAAIAARGINLYAVSLAAGGRGADAFLARDEAGVRSALTDAGIGYREVSVVTVALEDRPGTAAECAKRLADAGVNIELFAPVDFSDGKATILVGVDKVDEAQRVLSDKLTEWTVPAGVGAATAKAGAGTVA